MRILIIEGEKRLADTLADMVGGSGYCTDITYDRLEGLGLTKNSIYDAIVLDVMLPGLSELDVLSHLGGSRIMTPVLTLTVKSAPANRARGLDAEADYYLTKPFESQEFLACLRAVLRRQADIAPDSSTYGGLLLIPSTSQLSYSGRAVSLSAKELELMHLLIQNCNQFLPKKILLMKAQGYDSNVNTNSMEAYVSFPHEKLSLLDSSVHIAAVRNIGYRLEMS